MNIAMLAMRSLFALAMTSVLVAGTAVTAQAHDQTIRYRSNTGSITLNHRQVYACDLVENGVSVYVEIRTSTMAPQTVWDPDGRAGYCGSRYFTWNLVGGEFRLCERNNGCSAWTRIS